MTLELQNIDEAKKKLERCDTAVFSDVGSSYKYFVRQMKINSFRHINNLSISFEHPVTVIAGTNKTGKTSLLLLLACSHEQFKKVDSTSPTPSLRDHSWNDVISFTSHESSSNNYSYELEWRVGSQNRRGEGKRLITSKAWSGLAKKSSDISRLNAKIRDREVRLIDLERMLPSRSFTNALFRKANSANRERLNVDIEEAFAYIFDLVEVEIYAVGSHINKSCFLVSRQNSPTYSTFNAATGEESLISLLRDVIDSPKYSLILIDEIEAGFHPSVQRKLADLIQYIAWQHKKQFVITTHSPTTVSAFSSKSRRFIERNGNDYRVYSGISPQAARSKMDIVGYPLVQLYCEDDLASFLIKQVLKKMSRTQPFFHRVFNIVESGPIDQVKNDYVRHQRNFKQFAGRLGFCAVFDGDHIAHIGYRIYDQNPEEQTLFLYPHEAPEKFLVRSYLSVNNNEALAAALAHADHHTLFDKMTELGIASDNNDALSQCYRAFEQSLHYARHEAEMQDFLLRINTYFSELSD